MQTISYQTDILMLGVFRDEADVGIYKVVVSGAVLALFGLQIVNQVIGPQIATYFARGDLGQLQRIATIGSVISTCATFPVVIIFVFWGDLVLELIFGEGYVAGYIPLAILAVGQMLNAMFGSVGMLMNMTGHERHSARWLMISTLANVLLNILLIPKFGLVGAAIATSISIFIWNCAFWRMAISKLGVDGSFFSIFKMAKN